MRMTPTTVAIIGAVLSLGVGAWGVYAAFVNSKAQAARVVEQNAEQAKTIEFQTQVIAKTNEVAQLNAKLAAMTKTSQDLSRVAMAIATWRCRSSAMRSRLPP